ncbi:hypothetical protein N8I77_011371 [Diaporthe amygdali]|uniref:Xylanolytic transcriptional activator regulatory domain-containing protein n=1 Tax=Phomopsis amygdali TaxID=1214568 RepID=A0AAD9S873_PHOAM|nr:hypothetical protein N8I77_011371 [Diaporthe amygdali]
MRARSDIVSTAADATYYQCSREWPCNHCQARKVPHLCQFAPKKVSTPEDDSFPVPPRLSRKRKEDSFESDTSASVSDPDHGLSDGLAKLGYMPGHDVFTLTKSTADSSHAYVDDGQGAQSEEIEAALKIILPKPYSDILVQNYLETANFQYYPIFPEQLRGQSAKWWEARAAGQKLSPELTCLLIRVCAVSTQYLEASLLQRLEAELGEKAQIMTERFHAAAQKLSASIPRGKGGAVHVQQLFLEAQWYKSEACMVESWHSLSAAIREAQEINMHRPSEGLPNFERELRKRLWCILWTWDWQMSTLLSRPLLIDQDDHTLEIPDGRLENMTDPTIPHALSSVALQAELGLHVSHLFQKLGTAYSVELVLEIEEELEKWMGTFPAALRDHRPDTRWDQKHPNIPFMRCQLNIIAYAYLLAPLKPYLLSKADSEIMNSPLGTNLRTKGVDTCLDLMRASEQFYDLIFPDGFKYFFIIFFMFDAATVLCSAIVHDTEYTLPKRSQLIRALRTSQELMDAVAHLSESARLSAMLLRKLSSTLPLTDAEKQVLGVGSSAPSAKKVKTSPSSSSPPEHLVAIASFRGGGDDYVFSSVGTTSSSAPPSSMGATPYDMPQLSQQAQAHVQYDAAPFMPLADAGGMPAISAPEWPYVDYTTGLPVTQQQQQPAATADASTAARQQFLGMNPGDPLSGTFLEPLWDWDHLNMDLSQYAHFPASGPEF